MRCPKHFECYKSGLANLTKARNTSTGPFLECLRENPQTCEFSASLGNEYFCRCPLRVYIAEKIKEMNAATYNRA
ncbi:MAG: hypothetical protein DRP62_05605 [Planctomycetota bacterium]|nr:MAG: hypothetical protein DRP62_05605 [Planctomycetota bacterium]